MNASSAGTKNTFPITVDFASVTFTRAGVYRYVITESTTEATKNAAGIKDGGITATRYLDVYVKDGATAGTYDIYGYVCFTNNNSIDASDSAATPNTVAEAGKTEGFVATGSETADAYYTFNFEVKKVVENDQYIKTTKHQFPFTITLANDTVTANVLPIMTLSSSNATQTALTAAPIAGTWSPTIADSETVKYVGIPCGTTVTIYEKNDLVGATYTAVITKADTNGATKSIGYNEVSNNAVIDCGATALTAATENHTGDKIVTFTNTLLLISPTGVVIRVAPFMMILAAGIVLLVLSIRRRRLADDEA